MLANKYFYRREYDKSEALIREMQSMDSTYRPVLYAAWAHTRRHKGSIDEAVSLFQKALCSRRSVLRP